MSGRALKRLTHSNSWQAARLPREAARCSSVLPPSTTWLMTAPAPAPDGSAARVACRAFRSEVRTAEDRTEWREEGSTGCCLWRRNSLPTYLALMYLWTDHWCETLVYRTLYEKNCQGNVVFFGLQKSNLGMSLLPSKNSR